jgi:L-xylulokinase
MSYIGIDIGHTTVTAVAYDADWTVAGEYGVEGGMLHPSDDRTEIPIAERWGIVLECLDELADRIPTDGIDGIGLAGGGGGLYPLGADGEPAMHGVPLLDQRTRDGLFAEWMDDGTRRQISEITGIPLPPAGVLIMLRWLKDNESRTYEEIEHILNLKDVVRYKLTGELANEISDATFSLTNHQTQRYDEELFELAGIEDKWDALPELLPNSHDVAGHTTAEVERATGIPEGTPVVAGAHDACANTLGVGAPGEGRVTTAGGTWSLSTMALDEPVVDLDSWCCENFVESGTWMLEISTPTGTVSLDWFVEDFCEPERRRAEREDRVIWDVIEEKIEGVETNAIFHPFLFGNPWGYLYQDAASGSFTGLQPTDGRVEMLRAVYEAIAFMHRWQIDLYDEAFGVKEVRFTGGAARSDYWAGMFADVMATPVVTTTMDESGCFGAAMLAAIGTGALDGLADTEGLVETEDVYRPTDADYDRKYDAFRRLAGQLEPTWDTHYDLRR